MALELAAHSLISENFTAVLTVSIALALGLSLLLRRRNAKPLPVINGRKLFEFTDSGLKERYRTSAKELLEEGLRKSDAFYLQTDKGPRLVLANRYAREVHNNPHLSISKAMEDELHCNIPGMEGYKGSYWPDTEFGNIAIKQDIRKALESLVKSWSQETTAILDEFWTTKPEWHSLTASPLVLDMVSQLTARMRSGPDLAKSTAWRRLSISFTVHTFIAAADLDVWPWFLRPIVHWFLPSWKRLRADIEEARQVFDAAAAIRLAEKEAAIAKGESPPVYEDMLYWMEQRAKGVPFDTCLAQLLIAQAMIHGTADLTTQAIFDIAERPELIEELRAEILTVIGIEGLTSASLNNLKLMDSVIKESQRLKPMFLVTMKRYAEESIVLSDGVVIPKGAQIVVHSQNMWDEEHYSNPLEFQSHRFLERRKIPGQEVASQLHTTTINHMGFGFGRHGCPGRSYASAMMKIFLCHILLKYDIKLKGGRPEIARVGVLLMANHTAQIEVRRRQEELNMEELSV
ncbi:Cytochrome P450 [Penicillium chermesinum]|uniref:Cytochrome P450 n=1 Tax=Penicillium chermesinum TaxID=63820 RepID=A0A9W9TYF5_9EURO|nr:Cytochrome P450 [Penicillium chermesinum]KAJ5249007.1 Cytochrome P450 [Penicillium chermesinum]KAJ6151112.1 Cytochrome P450 [Penicillium chermesinum]